MTRSCVYDKKKWFYARFVVVGPEVVVIKESIWQEYLQSFITVRREEVRKLSTTGSVVNISSPEKRLNCGIVTIQIWFRPKI